jgi:hypothetical protein
MEKLLVQLVTMLQKKRYGKYRGVVADNKDPQQRGRLKLIVPSVLGDQKTDWALPCMPFGGGKGYGLFLVPEKDAQVWVEFEEGDIQRPIWTGTFWREKDQVPEDACLEEPTTRLLQTPGEHVIQFDDKSGEEQFRLYHPSGAEIIIDKDGVISLTDAENNAITLDAKNKELILADANGNTITLSNSGTTVEDANKNKLEMGSTGITIKDSNGNAFEMAASGITIKAQQIMLAGQGGEPVIKGSSFLSLFASHTHPGPTGTSGPPIPQGEASSLSFKVMTS